MATDVIDPAPPLSDCKALTPSTADNTADPTNASAHAAARSRASISLTSIAEPSGSSTTTSENLAVTNGKRVLRTVAIGSRPNTTSNAPSTTFIRGRPNGPAGGRL